MTVDNTAPADPTAFDDGMIEQIRAAAARSTKTDAYGVVVRQGDGAILVQSPYAPAAVKAFKALGGKWAQPCWRFPTHIGAPLEARLRELYGHGLPQGIVEIETTDRLTASQEGVDFRNGLMLASARGRDSGAKMADGVALLAGSARSGGSMKNWTTEVSAGAVFRLQAPLDVDWLRAACKGFFILRSVEPLEPAAPARPRPPAEIVSLPVQPEAFWGFVRIQGNGEYFVALYPGRLVRTIGQATRFTSREGAEAAAREVAATATQAPPGADAKCFALRIPG